MTFLTSYLFGYFLNILDRHSTAFFLTLGTVLEFSASSKIISVSELIDAGMIVASKDKARDCAASFLLFRSDSTEYMIDFQISSLVYGMIRLEAMYPVYFSSYFAELINPDAS